MTSGSNASPNQVMGYYRNTGATNITALSIGYRGERYRVNTTAASIQFFYSTNGTSWTAVTAGDIAAASFPTASNAYNFASGTVITVSGVSITGLSIIPTGDFYLRWNIATGASNSQGIGIDDVSVTATFAPGATNTTAAFNAGTSSIAENAGPTTIPFTITNPGVAATDTAYVNVLASGATGRISSYSTLVKVPGTQTSGSVSVTLNNNLACDGNQAVTFTITSVTGGQGTPAVGSPAAHVLTVNNDDVCTSVSFTAASATVSEGSTTYNLGVSIANFSTTQSTSVTVGIVSGNAARINGFSSQVVTFPANTGGTQNVTLTITDDGSCNGSEVLTFGMDNLTGGQGTPFVGPTTSRTLTITDNDASTGVVIARQAFDGLVSDTWAITSGAGNISTASGSGDTPASQRILSGTASWQSINASNQLDLASLDVSGYSNISLVLRTTSTSASIGNGVEADDSLRVFVNVNGAGFPATADVWLRGSSQSRWSYSSNQAASTIAGTPITVQAPSNTGNGPGTVTIAIPNGTQTIQLRIRAKNDASNEIWNVDDIQVTGDRCSTIYYSRADGNVGGAIWSDTPSGSAGSVTFDRFKSMVVQNGDQVNMNADNRIDDLTVDTGGQLDIAANTLTVSGDGVDINGTLTAANNSTVVLNSPNGVIMQSTNPISFFNLTANSDDGVLTDATFGIRGTLLLSAGEFDASAATVTIESTTAGTGRLGPVASGASYTGSMTVQRYIPAGATNWRMMGSPVSGATVNNWKDDFYTAGFPGSHSPGFSDPVGSGILWPSIRWYNETLLDANSDVGLVGATGTGQLLATGQGFAAWCGTSLLTTTAFTIDVTGAPHTALTPISLPVTYSNSGNPSADGFNMLSNPLPSPILWSNLARTNVGTTMQIYNPSAGNMGTYTIGVGGTLGVTDTIQSSQAFFVKANAASPVVQVDEQDKVVGNNGGQFGGSEVSTFAGLRLNVSSSLNAFYDETLVVFDHGTPTMDGDDVPKYVLAHPEAPQVSTQSAGGASVAINAYGAYSTDISIPVLVNAAVSGTYTVTASNMENLGLTCVVLEDLLTGTMIPLVEGAAYSFEMDAAADETAPRLMLHASAPLPLSAEAALCNGGNGQATVTHVGNSPVDITWTNSAGNVLLQQTIAEGIATYADVPAGEYNVRVSSNAGCGELSSTFRIDEPSALEATLEPIATSCPDTEDGRVDITVLGGTAPYSYTWSNGATDEDLVAAAGEYTVSVTDANGCELSSAGYAILDGMGPLAIASLESSNVLVNAPLAFENLTEAIETSTWDFGDGSFSEETSPSHSWNTPGTYMVTLTVSDGTCIDIWTAEVIVETSTSISTAATATGLNAWFANDKFVVEHNINNGSSVVIEVLDATGRLHATRKAAGVPARISINADGLATGIWFVRVSNSDVQRTLRVPLVR